VPDPLPPSRTCHYDGYISGFTKFVDAAEGCSGRQGRDKAPDRVSLTPISGGIWGAYPHFTPTYGAWHRLGTRAWSMAPRPPLTGIRSKFPPSPPPSPTMGRGPNNEPSPGGRGQGRGLVVGAVTSWAMPLPPALHRFGEHTEECDGGREVAAGSHRPCCDVRS
jgi:hypothetical protein